MTQRLEIDQPLTDDQKQLIVQHAVWARTIAKNLIRGNPGFRLADQLDTARVQAPHLRLLKPGVEAYLAMARVWLSGLQGVDDLLRAHVLQVLGHDAPNDHKSGKQEHLINLVDHMKAHGVKHWHGPVECLVSCWEPSDVRIEVSEERPEGELRQSAKPMRRKADELAAEYKRAKAGLKKGRAKQDELPVETVSKASCPASRSSRASAPRCRIVGRVEAKSTARGRTVAIYDYADEDGELLYQVVRYEPKGFRQRRPDGAGGWRRVL